MIVKLLLKVSGYSQENLRKAFQPESGEHSKEIKGFLDRMSARIQEGVNRNLKNAKWWWMIDKAYDAPQSQISYSVIRGIIDGQKSMKESQQMLEGLGLGNLMAPASDPVTGKPLLDSAGKPVMQLNLPVFTETLVPICMAYTKVRWATLFNDRDTVPLLKYSPLIASRRDKLKTDIITSRVERMTQDMGYRAHIRQQILSTLKYGRVLCFAKEPFYREIQGAIRPFEAGVDYGPSAKFVTDEETGAVYVEDYDVIREGVRWDMPHPSRVSYDLTEPLETLNTNTGCSYAFFWDIVRLGDVIGDSRYWIKKEQREQDEVYGISSMGWVEQEAWNLYANLYPCSISIPNDIWSSQVRSEFDRTSEAFKYTQHHHNQGVIHCNYYERINPQELGLFDYNGPVWFRFVVTNDRTVLYAEPFCFDPVYGAEYDADQNLWRNPSLVAEILPWQDQVSNLLTQYILTVKRNLANVLFYNSDATPKEAIDAVRAAGTGLYTDLNLIPVSRKELSYDPTAGNRPRELFESVEFSKGNTGELIQSISNTLMMLERVIGYTPAEVGTTAAHVQTAEEVRTLKSYTSTRIALTDSFIDTSIHALKVRLYEAFMSYGDDLVFAEVAAANEATIEELDAMGFQVELGPDRTAGVHGMKSGLRINGFSADREGQRRQNDSQIATMMMQMFQTIFGSAELVQAAGLQTIIDWFNAVADYAGVPKDNRLRIPEGTGQPAGQEGAQPSEEEAAAIQQQQAQALQQQVMEIIQQLAPQQMQAIGEALKKEVIDPMQKQIDEVSESQVVVAGKMDQMTELVAASSQQPSVSIITQ